MTSDDELIARVRKGLRYEYVNRKAMRATPNAAASEALDTLARRLEEAETVIEAARVRHHGRNDIPFTEAICSCGIRNCGEWYALQALRSNTQEEAEQ